MAVIEVELPAMTFRASHGVFKQEKIVGNEFEVYLLVAYHCDDADTIEDNLQTTVSYADLYTLTANCMAQHSDLLEHAVWRLAHTIRDKYPELTHIKVRIQKTAPPIRGMQGPAAVTYDWKK